MEKLIAQILISGMQTWNSERKHHFQKKHHKVLQKVSDASNAQGDHYNDDVLYLAREEKEHFMAAYLSENEAHNQEILQRIGSSGSN